MLSTENILFGGLVGVALGLTGSGGSILVIPFLVYGLGLPLHTALALSLLIVATLSFVGAVRQGLSGEIAWSQALSFSIFGMVISPLVLHLTRHVSQEIHLTLFGILMLFIALNMTFPLFKTAQGPSLEGSKPSATSLGLGGVSVGVLSGFFGVGSGFLIVPLLTLIFRMPYRLAVGTSLVVVTLVSFAGFMGAAALGGPLPWHIVRDFIMGGSVGILVASTLVSRVSETLSRRIFAVLLLVIGSFMLYENLTHASRT